MVDREEELLNSKQVAVILDMSPDTVNEFARKNILPAFKKGKQWRFRKREELEVATRALGSITGEDADADLLDRIFARFCIGK